MAEIGEFAGEGMAIGLEESGKSVQTAMEGLTGYLTDSTVGIDALNANAARSNAILSQTQSNASEFNNIAGLLAQYLPYLAEQGNIVLDDGTLVGRMAPAINDAMSVIQTRAERG